ncbi:MAG: SNF2-related protein [Rhodospirillales bacterium]|nr:SNF2-related protein [Rhodospirillales bacterium]
MSILQDHAWRLKYTPDHGDLVKLLYVPALACGVRYDRLTGFFAASALALAARGVERLIANGGRMRMIVGCTLEPPEIEAIAKGEAIKTQIERHILANPLIPPDAAAAEALELLAWMVAQSWLEIRVAVPCDNKRRPIPAEGLFHEKAGIIEDKTGDRLAFNGSLNETAAGWTKNWESLNVFTSWRDADRVNEEDANFARIWADRAKHVMTLDVPAAVRDDLLRFLPMQDQPARLIKADAPVPTGPPDRETLVPPPAPAIDLRRAVWDFIAKAPTLPNGGVRVGEITAAVTPWPHQVRAFHRLYDRWPPKLLIADEVGLGKTIEAGLLLRQAWLAGRAKRILILAPKNICRQWQIELREKFNLNWPIYDGQRLTWYPSPAMDGRHERAVARDAWHQQPVVIASSHLVRRADRQHELLDEGEPWDLIILDEAHHARRRGAGSAFESGPNALLRLMRSLIHRTQGLVLLTATPMQVHPVEVYDLLSLLGLPPEWTQSAFLKFFEDVLEETPSHEAFDHLAAMFRAIETTYGAVAPAELQQFGVTGNLRAKRILAALRDTANIPRRQLETSERKAALRLMRLHTPISRLISRHTRELLRRYYKAGKLSTPIADRQIEDRFIDLSPDERRLYDEVEDYITTTYNQASAKERNAVGFVMTIYRRRLASSFFALGQTLEAHLEAITSPASTAGRLDLDEDQDADDPEYRDADEAARLEQEALELEEKADIQSLRDAIRALPPDTKLERLRTEIAQLREAGYGQVMVFTQYTDTMDFLRRELARQTHFKIMCFSGRGGEVPSADGTWRTITRDDAKRRFREGQADVLLCTEAAAEGLNFQFCGALINYDMPWNPMRVEQRIGRIDRLGQKYPIIRIVNLHYAGTIETDVYDALRKRHNLFQSVVGRLQPILSRLPTLISDSVLHGRTKPAEARQHMVSDLVNETDRAQQSGFDIDAVTEADLVEPARPLPPLTMDDLETVIATPALLPPGLDVAPLGRREYRFNRPGLGRDIRVSTDPGYYEQHADTVELWSPGNPSFPAPEGSPSEVQGVQAHTLSELLDRLPS